MYLKSRCRQRRVCLLLLPAPDLRLLLSLLQHLLLVLFGHRAVAQPSPVVGVRGAALGQQVILTNVVWIWKRNMKEVKKSLSIIGKVKEEELIFIKEHFVTGFHINNNIDENRSILLWRPACWNTFWWTCNSCSSWVNINWSGINLTQNFLSNCDTGGFEPVK